MRLHVSNDAQVQAIAALGAYMAVVASSEDPLSIKTQALAISASCTAVLSLRRQVGTPPQNPPPSRTP